MLQSTILYKVSDPGDLPLDRNGVPVSVSGGRQAIAILEGYYNPNPALFEVVGTFNASGMFDGVKTFKLDPSCEAGFIKVEPARVDVSDGPRSVFVISGSAWTVQNVNLAGFSPSQGEAGGFQVEVSPGTQTGQGWVTFTNQGGGTARVYVINLPGALWILEDGTWNNDGKWTPDGIWNY